MASVKLPNGEDYKMGRTPSFFPFKTPCFGAGKMPHPAVITAAEWNGYRREPFEGLETNVSPRKVKRI
jgi:hypothetical protein